MCPAASRAARALYLCTVPRQNRGSMGSLRGQLIGFFCLKDLAKGLDGVSFNLPKSPWIVAPPVPLGDVFHCFSMFFQFSICFISPCFAIREVACEPSSSKVDDWRPAGQGRLIGATPHHPGLWCTAATALHALSTQAQARLFFACRCRSLFEGGG